MADSTQSDWKDTYASVQGLAELNNFALSLRNYYSWFMTAWCLDDDSFQSSHCRVKMALKWQEVNYTNSSSVMQVGNFCLLANHLFGF